MVIDVVYTWNTQKWPPCRVGWTTPILRVKMPWFQKWYSYVDLRSGKVSLEMNSTLSLWLGIPNPLLPILKNIYSTWNRIRDLIPNYKTEMFLLLHYLQNYQFKDDEAKKIQWILLCSIHYLFLFLYGRAIPPVFYSKPSPLEILMYKMSGLSEVRSIKYCKICKKHISRDGNASLNIAKFALNYGDFNSLLWFLIYYYYYFYVPGPPVNHIFKMSWLVWL